MKFGYTIIFVPDLQKTLKFYEDAFGFKIKFIAESGSYGELDTGSTILSFCTEEHCQREELPFQPTRAAQLAPPMEISFVTDDVESAFKKAINAGASSVKEPQTTPWGQFNACVRDINGILVEICTPAVYPA